MNFLEKAEQLPEKAKEFFFSNDIRLETEKACFLYGIPEERITTISDITAFIFIGDTDISELPISILEELEITKGDVYGLSYELGKRLFAPFPEAFPDARTLLDQWSKLKAEPKFSEEEATQMMLELEPWILEDEKEKVRYTKKEAEDKKTREEKLEKTSITDALKKYPAIEDQLLTSNPIKIKVFPEPVRPTIKNWIADYTLTLGYEMHDSMERGNFLFRSDNAKTLSTENREKLSLILKSFDDRTLISIDPEKKQVLFPEFVPMKTSPLTPNGETEKNKSTILNFGNDDSYSFDKQYATRKKPEASEDSNIKFSSPQIFPNEKNPEMMKNIDQKVGIGYASKVSLSDYTRKPERVLPTNVINLKN